MNSLILIRGLPGSGKSTFAKKLQDTGNDIHHFEADQYFVEKDEYKFDPSKLPLAHKWCQEITKFTLSRGHSVIVSNTFTKIWEMKPYLDMAKEMNIPVTVYRMTKDYGSIHNVPQAAIENMRSRFESYPNEILK